MSTDDPTGHGRPTDPGQNPYGSTAKENPYGEPGGPAPSGQAPPGGVPHARQPFEGTPQGDGRYGSPLPRWLTPRGYGGPVPPGSRTLASFGERFLARLVDFAVLLVPSVVLFVLFGGRTPGLASLAMAVVTLGYEIGMMLAAGQQTVGKKVMRLRVVEADDGGRPADGRLWARSAVYAVPQSLSTVGAFFSLLDDLWQLWDKPLQQCIHDKAGRTLVVKEH
ncbi:RDD family protein [Kitasatospora sp. NBC_01539]|uniref:RDD family protein n=1 Tax=Kitasatospora sp. NBC_01539 TaxID=2903577 RepID=UPI0038602076